MRYSLLNYIECPVSHTELTCVVTKEQDSLLGHVTLLPTDRVHGPGQMFGPVPAFRKQTTLTDFFSRNATAPADTTRNQQAAVVEGLLVSPETRRWYPIRNFVPEMLPDHLRNFQRDFEFLRSLESSLPKELFDLLNDDSIFTDRGACDAGVKYKSSEMGITGKVESVFFGPGWIAPFNPGATDHTAYLIRLYSFCLRLLLENGPNRVVLDAGCGYSWTTEWLLKMGMEPIGVDITKIYLDIAVARLNGWLPHVIQADTENLPIKSGIMDAVLCYEAFHHIPDRAKAMKGFSRILKPGKRVVLAEPGAAHESDPGSVDVMAKYGILERGMEIPDIKKYISGSDLENPVQYRVLEFSEQVISWNTKLSTDFVKKHGFNNSNLYTVQKKGA